MCSLSFDKCIHWYKHYHNQDIEQFSHPREYPCYYLQSVSQPPNSGNHWSNFYHRISITTLK